MILNELRSSTTKSSGRFEYADHPSRIGTGRLSSIESDTQKDGVQLSVRGIATKPSLPLAGAEDDSTPWDSCKRITVTTEYAVARESRSDSDGTVARQPFRKSVSSSEIDFASRGA